MQIPPWSGQLQHYSYSWGVVVKEIPPSVQNFGQCSWLLTLLGRNGQTYWFMGCGPWNGWNIRDLKGTWLKNWWQKYLGKKYVVWHLWLAKKWRYLFSKWRPLSGWPKQRKILMIKYIKMHWPVGQFCNSSYFPQPPLPFSRAPEQGGPDSREVGYSWDQQHELEFTKVN